jgi:hypothetical protein
VLSLDNPYPFAGVEQQVDRLLHARKSERGQAVGVVQFYNAGSGDEAHFLVDEMRFGLGFSLCPSGNRAFVRVIGRASVRVDQAAGASVDRRQHNRSACAALRASAITALSSAKFRSCR